MQECIGDVMELIDTYQKLQEADPLRCGYYADQIQALHATLEACTGVQLAIAHAEVRCQSAFGIARQKVGNSNR